MSISPEAKLIAQAIIYGTTLIAQAIRPPKAADKKNIASARKAVDALLKPQDDGVLG